MGIISNTIKSFALETKSSDTLSPFGNIGTLFGKKSDPSSLSHEKLLSLYKGIVFGACDAIGDGMAALQVGLYKDDKMDERVKNDTLSLITPSMVKAISIFLKTIGVVYIHKLEVGRSIDLTLLRSWGVRKVYSYGYEVSHYEYFDGKNLYRFEKDEIIELKSFSPLFSDSGMTPLRAVATQVATDFASIEFNKLFFENGGKPGVILKHSQKIDDNVRAKYLSEYKRNYTGLENQHKAAFMDQGIEIQTLNTNQKDMQINEQRQFTIDEVLMIFRVPKPILGKSDGVGFADRGVPGYYFRENCLKPLALQIGEQLNKELFSGVGFFGFVFSQDKDEILKEYQGGAITLNEMRVATGREPVKNGNVFWDGTEAEFDEESKKVKEDPLVKALSKGITKAKKEAEFGSEEYNQKLWEVKISRTDKYEEELAKLQKRIWKAQEDEVIANLGSEKSIKNIDKEDEVFDKKKSNLLYVAMMTKFFKDMMSKEGQISIEEVSAETFAIAKLNKWIGENIDRMSNDIDDVTRKEIFEIVKQGNRDKVGVAQISANVRKQFAQYTKKSGRVEKIVRTEITRASNKSQDEAYKQSGVVLQKEWYTAIDERRCQYCADLHGKKIKLGEDFLKLGDEHLGQKIDYETISHPPRHVSCRCTERPIIARKNFDEVQMHMKQKNINLKTNFMENE